MISDISIQSQISFYRWLAKVLLHNNIKNGLRFNFYVRNITKDPVILAAMITQTLWDPRGAECGSVISTEGVSPVVFTKHPGEPAEQEMCFSLYQRQPPEEDHYIELRYLETKVI